MPVFHSPHPFVLASASPRRRELLSWLGLDFSVMAAPSEARQAPGEAPADYAARAAREKACAVLARLAPALPQKRRPVILAADTIVILDGAVFGKPAGHKQAFAMLRRLAGRTHEVVTACCLLLPPGASSKLRPARRAGPEAILREHGYAAVPLAQSSRVSMWNCPAKALRAYAYSAEPMDKAGSYAVQGNGGFLIRSIEGSWSNVVGLPVSELAEIMLDLKLIAPAAEPVP